MQKTISTRADGTGSHSSLTRTTRCASLDKALQSLLDREARRKNVHSVLLGVQSGDGRISFEGAAGAATPDRPFLTASICKMFTATVLMQLVGEERVALDDTAASLLPHLDLSGLHVMDGTDRSALLTLRQLVHQTSGVADYFEGRFIADLQRGYDRAYDLSDVFQMLHGKAPFAAPDSGRSHYSDTNYQLLGAVIETVTKRDLPSVFAERIFEPIGMIDTYVVGDHTSHTRPGFVPLYYKSKQLDVPLSLSCMAADGGCVWTLSDALRFLKAYFRGDLFKASSLDIMTQWNDLYFPIQYGYGLMRFKLPRWMNLFRETPEFIGHSGISGAWAFYAPKEDIFLAGSVNQLDARKRPFQLMPQIMNTLIRYL